MKKNCLKLTLLTIGFILAFSILNGITMAQNNKIDINQLKDKIQFEFNSLEGNFALAFRDLSNNSNTILINENEIFHAASTMKTPVMIEVFKQAEAGKFKMNDSLLVGNNFKSIVDGSSYILDIDRDSGESLYESIGKKVTIKRLVYDMITVSSNLAANILIELVKAENVQNTMLELGAKNIKVLRGVEDMKAFERDLNNVTSAFDLLTIFEKIAEKKVINQSSCRSMINILLNQKHNEIIPAYLPEGTKVAHKTGSIEGLHHDSGIIYLPDGRQYILIILSSKLKDDKQAISSEAKISRMIYDFMQNF